MGIQYHDDDFDWVYPKRPLDLLDYWEEIDHLCKTSITVPFSRFQKHWLDKPEEFVIATQDDQLAAVSHTENRKKSAICHIVVCPAFQRSNTSQLLASRALDTVFNYWKKGRAFCDIGVDNRPAQILAASLGFERVAVYNKRVKYKLTWHDYRQGIGRQNT